MKYLLYVVLAVNLLGLLTMWWDKRCAQRDGRRVPEKNIFLVALCGGAIGCWAGMKLFRHKTKHWRFSIGLPLIVALQVGGYLYFRFR